MKKVGRVENEIDALVISQAADEDAWEKPIRVKRKSEETLEELIATSEIDTGISDLASQHDHYLYGKPKK